MTRCPRAFRWAALSAALSVPALCGAEAGTIFENANLTASETWTANNEYILTKPIYVTNGATLTIGPGTVIRGNPESAPGAHDPGTLIIARGSKIRALGTADKPIVFTDLLDDNIGSNPGTFPYDNLQDAMGTTAQWGGLILLGRTYVANNTLSGPDATREVQIEGLDPAGGLGLYGNGGNDDDDSGVVNYVSIRYGGFNLSANNEINGLTLGGVGRQTTIDYVDVMQTKDDFVECFGGTVNLKHIVGAVGGDDGLDTDEGFRGKVQFVFMLQGTPGADKNDKGGEWDGGNNPDGSQPFAIPTIYNATFIGLGQKSYTGKLTNLGAVFRDNAAGRVYNSFWADFGGAPVLVEGGIATAIEPNTSAERSVTAYTVTPPFYLAPASAFQLEMQNDEWWCMGNGGAVPTGDATAFGGVAGQIHYDPGFFSNASLNNHYHACATPLPIRALVRTNSGNATTPDPVISIDPRPVPGNFLTTTSKVPPADGFFEPAPYIGAFGAVNWAAGWTTMARLGYFPKPPQIQETANLTASETWTADNEYVLTKPIYVTNGATLTIGPGTVIRGNPESTPGAHDPGTLIITRGSKIRALGTADKPIVFTDLLDNNIGSYPGTFPYDTLDNALGTTAQWGGLILLGRAYVANNTLSGPDATREVQIEGLDPAGGLGLYGNGGSDDDDSGVVNYVSIRYGGFNLSANNEINGLTLGGVGRQTTIDYVDVMQTKDDFVECFGGTVNLRHIVGAVGGDDGLDTDEGHRGKVQFLFMLQGTPGADKNDKGGEWDGGNNPDGSQPFAIPTIYNATFVGLGQKSYTGKLTNLGAVFRDNAGGRVYNSFWADFGGAPVLVEGGIATAIEPNTSAERSVTAYTVTPPFYLAPPSAFQLEMQNDEWWCMGNGGGVPTGDATAFGGVAGQIHYDPGFFSNASLNNHYDACATPLPIRRLSRGTNPSPSAPDPVVAIDPRPVPGGPLLSGARATPADGFFQPAPYRGAFSPGNDWAAKWSTLSRLGYIPTCDPITSPTAIPDEVTGLSYTGGNSLSWSPLSFNTTAYDLVRSTSPGVFTTGTCVESGDVDAAATDATAPAVGQVFYYRARGRNACGAGPLGYSSSGAEVAGPTCS